MYKASLEIRKSILLREISKIIDNSKISKYLFIKLDESIVLFIPIFHFGCLKLRQIYIR